MKSGKSTTSLYNPNLKKFARNLRNYGTKSEACLWKYVLRAGLMKGYNFRRQRPILNFIADFLCYELKLVIELDGITHLWDETIEKDIKKDQALTAAGFTVLRFTDGEVLRNIRAVSQQIEWWIELWEEKNGIKAE